ncbi:Acetyl-coenzyme A carboxylase carboxyl transferase subunit alpha [Morus notabilis]|uniref:acetyl-CoA carboxytransferase n=1 Tax=Morus notabilis TaxID=981085 RepID=W9RSQ3_9ROSA|nr:Acetyl-coenzyme A carboxylase carboxyl transferase subunit alpha [Morus notabilis]
MSTQSLIVGNCGRSGTNLHGFSLPHLYFGKGIFGCDLLSISSRRENGIWSKISAGYKVRNRRKFSVSAKIIKGKKHDYPWPDDIDPNLSSGHLTYLSHFKPLTEKPKPVTLAFEKPLVRRMADETGLDFSDQIDALERKYHQVSEMNQFGVGQGGFWAGSSGFMESGGETGGWRPPMGTVLKRSMAHHSQTGGQTEVVNHSVETYLRCFVSDTPKQWAKWLAWAEYWYNTSYHIASQTTPFKILYGQDPPHLVHYGNSTTPMSQVDQYLEERNRMLEELKRHLSKAQQIMKKQADGHRRDVQFVVGDRALKDLYAHLAPIQRLTIARHPNRPTVLDHILNITEKWVELHGDRAGYDDPAIVTGIGSIDGRSYMFIGHQKGRNTKENIARNFAMPTPHGYRKALRMMKYADHHGLPIVTFVDTPGAFADLKSEELGQGEAIAHNLRTMFGLKVPIVTVVTGEGGSGGALAIACANKLFMLENSAFYVASPEACAAILWKSSQAAPKAAEKLRITAQEHYRLKIADGVIPEPLGGAHADPAWTSLQIKLTINKAMELSTTYSCAKCMQELTKMDTDELLRHRMCKFRSIGGFQEGIPVEPKRKRNMKLSEVSMPKTANIESEIENLKKKIAEAKKSSDPVVIESIENLKQEVDKEITNAFISMGLQDKLKSVKMELSKAPTGSPNQPLKRDLKEKVDKIVEEFMRNLSRPGACLGLKQKLGKLNMVSRMIEKKEKGQKLQTHINQRIPSEVKAKIELLKKAEENLSKGEPFDKDLVEEVERAKKELMEVLKSANLEIVGVTKRKKVAAPPPELKEKMEYLNKEIHEEIEKAINQAGLNGKIEELKAIRANGLSSKDIEKAELELKEKILATLDSRKLKEKVESLRMEFTSVKETASEGKRGVENGRL